MPTQTARPYVLHLGVSTSGAAIVAGLLESVTTSHMLLTLLLTFLPKQPAHLPIILGTAFLPPKVMAL
jgi:hypothetical protein